MRVMQIWLVLSSRTISTGTALLGPPSLKYLHISYLLVAPLPGNALQQQSECSCLRECSPAAVWVLTCWWCHFQGTLETAKQRRKQSWKLVKSLPQTFHSIICSKGFPAVDFTGSDRSLLRRHVQFFLIKCREMQALCQYYSSINSLSIWPNCLAVSVVQFLKISILFSWKAVSYRTQTSPHCGNHHGGQDYSSVTDVTDRPATWLLY